MPFLGTDICYSDVNYWYSLPLQKVMTMTVSWCLSCLMFMFWHFVVFFAEKGWDRAAYWVTEQPADVPGLLNDGLPVWVLCAPHLVGVQLGRDGARHILRYVRSRHGHVCLLHRHCYGKTYIVDYHLKYSADQWPMQYFKLMFLLHLAIYLLRLKLSNNI